MPGADDAAMMEAVTDRLADAFRKDPVAVMTGIYTGDGRRDWIFYTASVHIFGRKLNEALADLPLLPLTVYTENDPDGMSMPRCRRPGWMCLNNKTYKSYKKRLGGLPTVPVR